MNKKAKTAIKATALIAGAAGAASYAAYRMTRFLVGAAMDREEPRVLKNADKLFAKAKVSDDMRAFMQRVEADSARLAEQENETVEIVSRDGVKLVGHFIPAEQPERILIAMHGWRSSWTRDFGMIADFWKKNHCSVLFAEQRGQNNSGGECMGFGLTERFDCLEWIRWVTERCGDRLPIYLCGVSMGATTVLMAAGLSLPQNVHGIMADCAFTSPDAIWRHVANKNLHLIYDLHRGFADALCREKLRVGLTDYSTIDALRTATVPVLFIHGTDDHFVPVRMTYENYKACAAPKRLLIVPGADHGMSYFMNRDEYEKRAREFWQEFDGQVPACRDDGGAAPEAEAPEERTANGD